MEQPEYQFLDANQWSLTTKSGRIRDWRNQNEYTISIGGPIIKNKTFFFASWDQQFSAIKQNNANYLSPTPCARLGIWRYMSNVNGGNVSYKSRRWRNGDQSLYHPTVDANGVPLTTLTLPNGATTPGTLNYMSVFGKLLKTPQTERLFGCCG